MPAPAITLGNTELGVGFHTAYASYYADGLRVLDLTDLISPRNPRHPRLNV